MKRGWFSLLVGLIIGGLIVFLVFQLGGQKKVKSYAANTFDPVTSQLDAGGEIYVYLSVERALKAFENFYGNLRKAMANGMTQPEAGDILRVFDLIWQIYRESGFPEVSGIGMSSVALEESLNHSKCVIHHYPQKGKGLIWNLMAEKTHDLMELNLLPAETVAAGFSDFNGRFLWEWIKNQARTSRQPKFQEAIARFEPWLKKEGIELDKALNSLRGPMGSVLTLSTVKKNRIPSGETFFEIPEPGLALVFFVADSYLFDLLQTKLTFAKRSDEKGMKRLKIEVPPLPVTVDPTIVYRDNLLILASNPALVDQIFLTRDKGHGLTATDEFMRLSRSIPQKGNRVFFVGARLLQTVKDLVNKAMLSSGPDMEGAKYASLLWDLIPKNLAYYGIVQNRADGVFFTANHTFSLEQIFLLPVTAQFGAIATAVMRQMAVSTQADKSAPNPAISRF